MKNCCKRRILISPIIDYIKQLGKQIQNKSISYYSEKDKFDVFVGIDPLSKFSSISVLDLF